MIVGGAVVKASGEKIIKGFLGDPDYGTVEKEGKMKKNRREILIEKISCSERRLIRLDDIFLDSPLWTVSPKTAVLRHKTVDGMPVWWYEQGNDRLKVINSAGIPDAKGMQVLAVLIWLAQSNKWGAEMYVHPADVLELLYMEDSGQHRDMVREYVQIWRRMALRYQGLYDGDDWEYLDFGPLDHGHLMPVGPHKGLLKITISDTFRKMMSGAGFPESRYIQIDVAKYAGLSGGLALRLYDLFKQNLTYRRPDTNGIIRWPIGAIKLAKKIGVGIPVKELTRCIKNALEQLRQIAKMDVDLRQDGCMENTVYHFSTRRRLDWDELSGSQTSTTSKPPSEESPVSDILQAVISKIRVTRPGYPRDKIEAWRRVLERLVKDGRASAEILNLWSKVYEEGRAGSEYHAAVSLNPWRFANAYTRLLVAQRNQEETA